jgi:enterochelin esterase-like enzyme
VIDSERTRLSALVERTLAGEGAEGVVGLARRHRGPVVEEAGDGVCAVTFVFADGRTEARQAAVVCPALPEQVALLRPLGGGVFAGTHLLPRGTRVKYHYAPDPPALDPRTVRALVHSPTGRRVDRLNPATDRMAIPELRLLVFESVLTLPGARPAPWSDRRPAQPAGAVVTETIHSEALGEDRRVTIYRPPCQGAGPLPLVLLLDGQHAWWRAPALFDNLIADGAAVPFVAALVGVGRFSGRLRELAGSPSHARFLTGELLPWLAARCSVKPDGHVVAGFSAGALGAAYAALAAPDLFSGLVALSGPYHLTTRSNPLRPADGEPWLPGEYERAERLPARAYVAAGLFEDRSEPTVHAQGDLLAGVLRRRGVTVRFDSGPTGHDTFTARARLADGLAWMLSPRQDG